MITGAPTTLLSALTHPHAPYLPPPPLGCLFLSCHAWPVACCRNISEPMILILREIIPGAPCRTFRFSIMSLFFSVFFFFFWFLARFLGDPRRTTDTPSSALPTLCARSLSDLRSHHLTSPSLEPCLFGCEACGRSGPGVIQPSLQRVLRGETGMCARRQDCVSPAFPAVVLA